MLGNVMRCPHDRNHRVNAGCIRQHTAISDVKIFNFVALPGGVNCATYNIPCNAASTHLMGAEKGKITGAQATVLHLIQKIVKCNTIVGAIRRARMLGSCNLF